METELRLLVGDKDLLETTVLPFYCGKVSTHCDIFADFKDVLLCNLLIYSDNYLLARFFH